ncbi:MAG: hypothetical protein LBF89_11635 [Bacteroidales bacterium]|jgi:hypothetical protein|nr:hypothetical protein [Bacteroidales bacterium]
MKKLKFLLIAALLAGSYAACGQDLIVTVTGDSLPCKIIDVQPESIYFQLSTEGQVIYIARKDVRTHRYNVRPQQPAEPKPTATQRPEQAPRPKPEPVQKTKPEPVQKPKPATTSKPAPEPKLQPDRDRRSYGNGYLAINAGAASFGSILLGEDMKMNVDGPPLNLGIDGGCFFGQGQLGVGLKVNLSDCNVIIKLYNYDFITFHDRVIYAGPSFYGRIGRGVAAFIFDASVGGLSWKMSEFKLLDPNDESLTSYEEYDDSSGVTVAGCLSAGLNVMFSPHVGMNLKMQSLIAKAKDGEFTRKITNFGGSLGLSFRF